MPQAEAAVQAIHLMRDAQAILDGIGADLAAAHLETAIHWAERFRDDPTRWGQPSK